MDKNVLSSLLTICFLEICSCNVIITKSSPNATIREDFNFTCKGFSQYLSFSMNSREICLIGGTFNNGSCRLYSCLTNYTYACESNLNRYTLTIPGLLMLEDMHSSQWRCEDLRFGDRAITVLYVNIPVSKVTISAPNNANPMQIVQGSIQQFVCTTDIGRPASQIQFFLNDINMTSAASQTDSCVDCSSEKYTSSSTLMYTGKISDEGKRIFCTAFNIIGYDVRSMDIIITILYGPKEVNINPPTKLYEVSETESLKPITCTADCKPPCAMTWRRMNVLVSNTSILNLQNIDRRHEGNYSCIATNSIGSSTSMTVSIIVNCLVLSTNLKDNQNKAVLNAGIGLIVVSILFISVAVVIVFTFRRRLKKKLLQNSRSETYRDINRQNPGFTETYEIVETKDFTVTKDKNDRIYTNMHI